MKKVYYFSLIIFFGILQFRATGQSWVFSGGLNIADMRIKNAYHINGNLETKMRLGYNLGVNYEIPLGNSLSIGLGLVWSQKGFIKDFYKNDPDFDIKVISRPHYIELPVYAKANIDFKKFVLTGSLGIYAGTGIAGLESVNKRILYMGVKEDYISNTTIWSWNLLYGTNYLYKASDYGLSIATGIDFNSYVFMITYEYGINNIGIPRPPYLPENPELYNRALMFSVGYKIVEERKYWH